MLTCSDFATCKVLKEIRMPDMTSNPSSFRGQQLGYRLDKCGRGGIEAIELVSGIFKSRCCLEEHLTVPKGSCFELSSQLLS